MNKLNSLSFLQKASHIKISSSLAFIALGTPIVLSNCGASQENTEDYEEVEILTKGVKTYITETETGVFKISKEENASIEQSGAQITYLNGNSSFLSASEAKDIIEAESRSNPTQIGKAATIGNTLLYSGLGYLISSQPGSKLGALRPNDTQAQVSIDSSKHSNNHNRHNSIGFFPMFWMSRAAFSSGIMMRETMASSRVRTTRPIGGRSGFFGRSSRSGYSG